MSSWLRVCSSIARSGWPQVKVNIFKLRQAAWRTSKLLFHLYQVLVTYLKCLIFAWIMSEYANVKALPCFVGFLCCQKYLGVLARPREWSALTALLLIFWVHYKIITAVERWLRGSNIQQKGTFTLFYMKTSSKWPMCGIWWMYYLEIHQSNILWPTLFQIMNQTFLKDFSLGKTKECLWIFL